MRYFVHRIVFFTSFLIMACAVSFGFAQNGTEKAKGAASASVQTVSAQIAEAEAAVVKSDWKTATAILDAWLTDHPTDARALFDAGYVADAQNRADDALKFYQRAVSANPQSFEAHAELGLLLARENKSIDARVELIMATQLDSGAAGAEAKARIWRALAQIDRVADPATASADLLEALRLSPETVDDTLLAANLSEQAGQLDAADAAYRRVLAKDANSSAANSGLAHLLIERKQYAEAETLLRAALAHAPDDVALTAQLAAALAAQDKAEALPLLQKLHAARPNDAAVTRMLADVLAVAGDAAGADKLYAALLAASPNDAALLIAHGQNLIRQLKYAEAFATFDKATRVDPANADAWSGLAFAASKTAKPAIAIHALTMRAKYLPELPSTYFLWAVSYDSLNRKAEAAVYYHLFLDAAAGKFPNQEWQARQRLLVLEPKK
jgi:predicted Zn-dependent protease